MGDTTFLIKIWHAIFCFGVLWAAAGTPAHADDRSFGRATGVSVEQIVEAWERDQLERPPHRLVFRYAVLLPRHALRALEGKPFPAKDRTLAFSGEFLQRGRTMRWDIRGPIEWMVGKLATGRVAFTYDLERFQSLWTIDDGTPASADVFSERRTLALGNGTYALILGALIGERDPQLRKALLLPDLETLVVQDRSLVGEREVIECRVRWRYSSSVYLRLYVDAEPPHRVWRAEQWREGGSEAEITYDLNWDTEAGYLALSALKGWQQLQKVFTITGQITGLAVDPDLVVKTTIEFPVGARVRKGRHEDDPEIVEYVVDASGRLRPAQAQTGQPTAGTPGGSWPWAAAIALAGLLATGVLLAGVYFRRRFITKR